MFLLVFSILVACSFSKNIFTINPSSVNVNLISNDLSSDSSENCACDIMTNACDSFCCCDGKCNINDISYWNAQNTCSDKSYISPWAIPDCSMNQTNDILDLYSGLRIYFNFIKGLLCIKYTNVDTSEMIIAQKSFSDQQTDILIRESYYSSPATTLNSLIIKLYRLYSDTYWGKLKFNKNVDGMGAYCQSVDVLLRESDTGTPCINKFTSFRSMCSSGSLADIQAYYGFKISTNTISSGVLANFLNIYYINQNSTFNSIASNISVSPILTVLNDSKCSCQNVLYKGIYNFSVNAFSELTNANFSAIIYENITADCNSSFDLEQTFATYYNTGNFTYIRSNNQGYLKGDDLLIGIPTSSANLTAISVLFPFSFYRFDENGYCYQENNNLTKLEDQDSVKFGVNTILTCNIEKSLTELMNFCLNSTMYNQSIYSQFSKAFQYIGAFANANPLFIEDWINVVSFTGTDNVNWNDITKRCSFNLPTLLISYSKFGSLYNFQYKINNVATLSNPIVWSYNQINENQKQTFSISLIIQFIELSNNPVFYTAPSPRTTPYLANDVLYPFYEASASADYLMNNIFLIGIFLLILQIN